MTITRRAFAAGIGTLFVSHIVGECTNPTTNSGNPTASSTGPSGVRELVTMDQPDFIGMGLGHVSPDPTGIETTVTTATVDPSHHQCLLLWEEGNASTTTGPNSGGHGPAGFRPTVTSMPATGDTTARGAVLLCTDGASTLRGGSSDCYPTAARLLALGHHCFVVNYHVRPRMQAETGYGLARATRFVHARTADCNLPSAQHVALGGYSAGGILCSEMILNWSGSTSPTELDADYTPGALDVVSTDATATAMTYSFYGRLSVAELDPSRLTEAVPTYYCYGTKDPFYGQSEAQAKILAESGVMLRARALDGQSHGFGAEGGWIKEYDILLQQAFAST